MDEAENQDCEAMGCGERTSPKAILGFGYGSIPINTIFRGMNIHLPAILMWTEGVPGFDTLPFEELQRCRDPQLRNSIKPFVELFFWGDCLWVCFF